MPALPMPLPDASGAVRAWVRATGIFDNRAYLGPPEREVYPLVLIRRLGGSPIVSGGGLPIYEPLMELAVFGADRKAAYDTAAAATLLEEAIEGMASGTPMGDSAVGLSGHVQSRVPRPDPDSGQACEVITAEFQMRSA